MLWRTRESARTRRTAPGRPAKARSRDARRWSLQRPKCLSLFTLHSSMVLVATCVEQNHRLTFADVAAIKHQAERDLGGAGLRSGIDSFARPQLRGGGLDRRLL